MVRQTVKVEGLRDLEKKLGELANSTSSATARNTIRRSIIEAAEPTALLAKSLVRVKSGRLRDSIVVSSKLANPIGQAEYAAAMRAGLGAASAVVAKRDALRAAKGSQGDVVAYVGAGQLPHAHLIEFGTFRAAAFPYMRPAWDATKNAVLDGVVIRLGQLVDKAIARVAARGSSKGRSGGRFDTRPSKG